MALELWDQKGTALSLVFEAFDALIQTSKHLYVPASPCRPNPFLDNKAQHLGKHNARLGPGVGGEGLHGVGTPETLFWGLDVDKSPSLLIRESADKIRG